MGKRMGTHNGEYRGYSIEIESCAAKDILKMHHREQK